MKVQELKNPNMKTNLRKQTKTDVGRQNTQTETKEISQCCADHKQKQ